MRHAWHQFLWQVRRRRGLLAIHALLWFLLTAASWTTVEWFRTWVFYAGTPALSGLLLVFALSVILTLESAGADPAAGTDSFWRTRPPRWRSVWGGKVLFVVFALGGPALLCWLINGLLLDQTAPQWRRGLAEPALLLSALLVLMALRSMARGWTAVLTLFAVAGALIYAGGALLLFGARQKLEMQNGLLLYDDPDGSSGVAFSMVMCLVPAVAIVAVWALAMRRRLSGWTIAAAVVWVVAAPVLLWLPVRRSLLTHLTVSASVPGEKPGAGDLPLGLVTVRRVPAGLEAGLVNWDNRPPWVQRKFGARDGYAGIPFGYRRESPDWLTARQGQRLREALPPVSHWYSDGGGEAENREFSVYEKTAPRSLRYIPQPYLAGRLYASGTPFSVPVVTGAVAARDGTRIVIRSVSAGSRNLAIMCDFWQSRQGYDLGEQELRGVFVLYLPSVPFALLLNPGGKLSFSSLQSAACPLNLRATMPDAEFISGHRFTSDILQGATLWHFGPGESEPFEAHSEGETLILDAQHSPP